MKKKFRILFVWMLILYFVLGITSIQTRNISGEQPIVLYDIYHSLHGETVYSRLNLELSTQFSIKYANEILTEDRLFGCEILVISTPINVFSREEIYNVKRFVEEGGGLLLMGTGWYWVDYHKKPIGEYPLNQIMREFGVMVNDDGIIDPTNQVSLNFPIFTNFAIHPVTEGLIEINSGIPSSLSVTGNAIPIVMGDEDSYSGYHKSIYEAGGCPPAVAALEYGKGRIVFVGQDSFFANTDLDKYDNRKFGLNIFNWLSSPPDNDNDGYSASNDCNDNDPTVYPGATELDDGKDNDCDGSVDEEFDKDGDGYTTCGGDCNDNDPTVYPGATELDDGKDNDCDGSVDEEFDKDGDGYTTCGGDCNDNDPTVYPGATETCDRKDNDCDGSVDEEFDKDGDGYTTCGGDCNDNDPTVYPGAKEPVSPTFYGFLAAFIVISAIISLIILEKFTGKREVEEVSHTVAKRNTQDLMILSLEKRTDTKYQVSLESVHETIYPVRSARTIDIPPEMRLEIIARVGYTSKVIAYYLDPKRKRQLKKPTEKLKKMGTIIYKNFIPRDFAHKLIHHYMVLEVEDVQIPWELMYSDQFFALKYAISRRVRSEKVPEIQKPRKGEKKALIIADPTEKMPEAITECDYLEKTLRRYFAVTYLKPEEAEKVDVMYYLSQGYDIIHYAGELKTNSCLPVYKDVLTCEEIERNLEGSPVVFLNGCGSAKSFSSNIEGLAKVFLQRGALSFIGSLWSIHDKKAAKIAAEFYKNCLYYPVGEALRLSRKRYYSFEDITWAAFVMYGDPTLNLCK